MARRVIALVALAAGVVLACAAVAGASSASGWHVGYYNNSQLSNAQAGKGGLASLHFTSDPNTALLVTNQKSLTGDLTGKTITATANISGVTGAFTYYGKPDGCGTPANMRLYFETSNAGGFDYTHYWWANPDSAVLANGTLTLTATVEPADWSDWNGTRGTDAADGFAAAAANVTNVGISFGGGCFFENGVGTDDGSGTLTLTNFSLN